MSLLVTLGKLKRILYIFLGLVFLALGIVGYFMPGLPGTVWIIISATFFVRSSDRLYSFVVNNRFFGNQVREFLETGKMPIRAKVMSIFSIWLFSSISVLFAPYGLLFDIPVLVLAATGTLYILSRPSK